MILVTSKKHIAEFSEITCLSHQAVYADVGHPCTTICGGRHYFTLLMPNYQIFGFKHTMESLEHDCLDHKVARNRFNNRLLEVKGPAHLEVMYPNFLARFQSAWEKALAEGRILDGK